MKIYKSASKGIWAHELLLNLSFRLSFDAVFLLPNLGFSMSHLICKIKASSCSHSTCVDKHVVVSGLITCRTVIHLFFVVFMVQNFTFYCSNYYN